MSCIVAPDDDSFTDEMNTSTTVAIIYHHFTEHFP